MSRTHYEILGVPPDASTQAIREAYRRLAREHHPDRTVSGNPAPDGPSMPEINEARRVLSDPARRAVYDAGLRGQRVGPAAPPRDHASDQGGPTTRAGHRAGGPMHPSHLAPARIPWRSLLVVGVVAIVGIVVLAQFTEPSEPLGPDGILRVGDCVEIEADNDAREVACTGDPSVDRTVAAFVAFDASCPGGTAPHRDRQGMGVACVDLP